MAMGRSPLWSAYVAGPRNRYGAVPNSSCLCSRTKSKTVLLPLRYRWPVLDATEVVDCDSQWNNVGLIGKSWYIVVGE